MGIILPILVHRVVELFARTETKLNCCKIDQKTAAQRENPFTSPNHSEKAQLN